MVAEENKKKILEGTYKLYERREDGCVHMDILKEQPRDRSINIREQVAKLSGVGTGTVVRYDAVIKSDQKRIVL